MTSKLVIETRMEDQEKWEAYGSFDDFNTCLAHIIDLKKSDQRVVRLVVPGGFQLEAEDVRALDRLGVRHND